MKLSEALAKGLIKEGDEIEVSFKAKILKHNLIDLMNRLELQIHPSFMPCIYISEELELIEWINPSQSVTNCNRLNTDVGKTFKLSEAKEHLKVGMVIELSDQNKYIVKADIEDIKDDGFLLSENYYIGTRNVGRDDGYWTFQGDERFIIKILSDPTCKESLPVQVKDIPLGAAIVEQDSNLNEIKKRVLNLEFSQVKTISELKPIEECLNKIESLIGEPDTGIEHGDECVFERLEKLEQDMKAVINEISCLKKENVEKNKINMKDFEYWHNRISKLESFMELHKTENAKAEVDHDKISKLYDIDYYLKDHAERIDELEDQVQKLKKENESIGITIRLIEQWRQAMPPTFIPIYTAPSPPSIPDFPWKPGEIICGVGKNGNVTCSNVKDKK